MSIALRLAIRALRRQASTSTLLWLIVGFGSGISGAVFAAALVVARPVGPDQAAVFRVYGVTPSSAALNLSPPDFHDFRAAAGRIDSLAAITPFAPQLTLTGRGDPRLVVCRRVSAGFFRTLGVPLLAGREFIESEEVPPARPAIISEPFWRDVLGSRSDAVGQPLLLNGSVHTVVGVAASHEQVLGAADLWLPIQFPSREIRGLRLLIVIGRTPPGRPPDEAAGELMALAAPLRTQYPATHAHAGVRVVALDDAVAGPLEEPMRVMAACALLFWLLTASVAAGYAVALALQRRQQAAVARALGASTLRVWMLDAALHALLVTLALPLSAAAATWTLSITEAARLLTLPRSPSGPLAVLFGAALLAATFLVMMAALRLVPPPDRPDAMRGAGRCAGRGQRLVVVAESACAVVLLTLGGALAWGMVTVSVRDPGFTPANRLYARLTLPQGGGTPSAARWRALTASAAALPGASATALTTELPHTGQDNPAPFTIDSREGHRTVAGVRAVSAGYPAVAGLQLLEGRWLEELDDERRPRVVLVSARLARELFGTVEVVDRRLDVDVTQPPMTAEIVGVVSDVRHASLWDDVTPESYFSILQVALPSATLVIDSTLPPVAMQPAFHAAMRAAEPDMAIPMLARWSDAVHARIAPHERRAFFAAVLALMAMLLAAAGLYAVVAQTLEARRHELAVRIALGCPPKRVQRRLLVHGTLPAIVGAIPGALLAAPLARASVGTLAPSATSVAAVSALTALVVFLTVSVLAAWKPAREAARLDPASILRS